MSLEDHKYKPVSKELIDKSDLILVMRSVHKEILLRKFRNAEGKIYLLSEFVGDHDEVIDPFGRGINAYRKTAKQLKRFLIRLKEKFIVMKNKGVHVSLRSPENINYNIRLIPVRL